MYKQRKVVKICPLNQKDFLIYSEKFQQIILRQNNSSKSFEEIKCKKFFLSHLNYETIPKKKIMVFKDLRIYHEYLARKIYIIDDADSEKNKKSIMMKLIEKCLLQKDLSESDFIIGYYQLFFNV